MSKSGKKRDRICRRRFDVPVISSGPLLEKQVGFKVKDLSFFLLV